MNTIREGEVFKHANMTDVAFYVTKVETLNAGLKVHGYWLLATSAPYRVIAADDILIINQEIPNWEVVDLRSQMV